jgi:hypothetical protein
LEQRFALLVAAVCERVLQVGVGVGDLLVRGQRRVGGLDEFCEF